MLKLQSRKKKENNEKDHVKKKSITTNAWMSTKIDDYCLCINILLWRIISSQTLLPPQKLTKDGYFHLLMSLLPCTKANKLMQKWDIRSRYKNMSVNRTFKDNTSPRKKKITLRTGKNQVITHEQSIHLCTPCLQKKKKKLCQSHSHGGKFVLSIATNWV